MIKTGNRNYTTYKYYIGTLRITFDPGGVFLQTILLHNVYTSVHLQKLDLVCDYKKSTLKKPYTIKGLNIKNSGQME